MSPIGLLPIALALALSTGAGGRDRGQGETPPAAPPDEVAALSDTVEELTRQHARLLDEAERMRMRIERLARAVREQGHRGPPGDLAPLLAALNSEDFTERSAATEAVRRSLVDRMWLLIEAPDLGLEARQRLKSILVETSAMIRLTTVAVELDAAQRDALWNLLDAAPAWLLDALGDEPDRIQDAVKHPPIDHDLAAEIVICALIRDDLRPLPQSVALNEITDASSPLLREALKSLLLPLPPYPHHLKHLVSSNRDRAAARAVEILVRQPTPELIGFLLAYLKATDTFSARLEFKIIEALVSLNARHAAHDLLEIAQEKRRRLTGGHGWENIRIKPGDCELVGAALLLGLDLEDLKVKIRKPWSKDEPSYYGFAEPPPPKNQDRTGAFKAVQAAIEAAGPFDSVPGYQNALQELWGR